MQRERFVAMVTGAALGQAYELSAFREAAIKAGYTGGRGGWVKRDGALVCRGWQALARQALDDTLYTTRHTIWQAVCGSATDAPSAPARQEIRMIHTGSVPGTHLVPVRNGLLERLVCGELHGGTLLPGVVDEARVDCLACLDGWVELRRAALGLPPVTNASAGLTG